jgi:ubiquinone/menaquinone biosynthesis C-methylase UbiE
VRALEPADWAARELPDTWLDLARPRGLRNLWELALRLVTRRPRPVRLPEGMPGRERLPGYLLQEFHQLPNGNFSKTMTGAYAVGFDRVMLGVLVEARALMAERLAECARVLDVGAGAGHVAAALRRRGVPDVWALEPSPYLLQQAARETPGLTCVQAVIEESGLPDRHFDGAAACFVFHEMPREAADRALAELRRILRPGGRLVIVEPSAQQAREPLLAMWRRHGWRGAYFRLLARGAFEPFLDEWHDRDHAAWLGRHGFRVEEDRDCMPWRMLPAVAGGPRLLR